MRQRRLTVGEAEQVVTVGEAAEVLGLSVSMVKKLIRGGRLVSIVTRMGHLVTRRSLAAERRRRRRAA